MSRAKAECTAAMIAAMLIAKLLGGDNETMLFAALVAGIISIAKD